MSFDKLQEKVAQCEQALEARERSAAADWRQFGASWKQAWTPGRIVVAGLASGFLIGKAQPLRQATGAGTLQLISAVAGIFSGGSAQVAAQDAQAAADSARAAAELAPEAPGAMPPPGLQRGPQITPEHAPDTWRQRGDI